MVEPVSATAAAAPNVVGAALAQGGSNVLSTLLSNRAASHQARMANNYNIMMWQAENEYNKPINQMKRFAEAGLNPNLIYGQGNAGNAGSAPAYVPAEKRYDIGSAVGNALSTYMALSNMKKDAELKDAQVSNIQSKTATEDAKRAQMFVDNLNKNRKFVAELEYLRNKGKLTYEQTRRIQQIILDAPAELQLKRDRFDFDRSLSKKYPEIEIFANLTRHVRGFWHAVDDKMNRWSSDGPDMFAR